MITNLHVELRVKLYLVAAGVAGQAEQPRRVGDDVLVEHELVALRGLGCWGRGLRVLVRDQTVLAL